MATENDREIIGVAQGVRAGDKAINLDFDKLPQPWVICAECGNPTFGCIMRGDQRYCLACATKGADLG